MIFVGVDPGVSGGIAVIDQHGRVMFTLRMPDSAPGIVDGIAACFELPSAVDGAWAVIERVWSSPQMGVVSAMSFGKNVGRLEAALAAQDCDVEEVLPRKWQDEVGVFYPKAIRTLRPNGKESFGARDKHIPKRRAEELFPGATVSLATADALLIAEYCRRIHG